MAIIFADSFDHYATAELLQKWTSQSNTTIAAVGRNATNGARISAAGFNGTLTKGVTPGSASAGGVGVAWQTSALFNHSGSNPDHVLQVLEGITVHLGIGLNTSGFFTIERNTTVLATASVAISPATYYYLEFKWNIHDSTGSAELKINGTTVASVSGVDTRNGGAGTWNTFRMYNGSNNAGLNIDIDDLVIWDTSGATNNDFLGPIRVKAILPDGAGASTDFTPSAGSNFQNVDDTLTDGDSTYNAESTPGDHDTYTYAAVGLTGTVRAVQTNLMVRSNGAGSETIRPKIRISAVDYNGTTVGVTTTYSDSREVHQVSPATAVAWTVAEIDAAEFGIELVS